MPLSLEIITPEGIVFKGDADSVVVPTDQGEMGILPGHIPLIARVAAGDLVLAKGDKREAVAVDNGFVEILGDAIAVTTEAAIEVSRIDMEAVEASQRQAEAALQEARKNGNDPDLIERLEGSVRFAIAQRLAKGRRSF